jgi:hypothetical protein
MRPAALLLSALLIAPAPARATEEPAYAVLAELPANVEVRDYAPLLMAEVTVAVEDFGRAGGLGFQPLADYIFGNNTARERIGMTAPVTQGRSGERIGMTAPVTQSAGTDGWVVGFVMPARYTAETLPQPRDPRIRVVAVPRRTLAAIRYSGRWNPLRYAEQWQVLKRELAEAGWVITGEPMTAQYDAPWVPGPLRRNEILVPVRRRG